MPDLERLQSTLDEIAGTVDWALKWMAFLEDETNFDPQSDRPILETEAARLRVVADWFQAESATRPRAADGISLLTRLGNAMKGRWLPDPNVEQVSQETEAARGERERRERAREESSR
jgi:hypothetical protein